MATVDIAFALSEHTVFLCGPVSFSMDETSVLALKGRELAKPYVGGAFEWKGTPYYFLVVHDPALADKGALIGLTLTHGGQKPVEFATARVFDAARERFLAIYEQLEPHVRDGMLRIALQQVPETFGIGDERGLCALVSGMLPRLGGAKLTLDLGGWLTPSVLYAEGSVPGAWPAGDIDVTAVTASGMVTTKGRFFQTGPDSYSLVAMFPVPVDVGPRAILIRSGAMPVTFEGGRFLKLDGLELPQAINEKPEYQRHLIREEVARFVVPNTTQANREAHRALLSKLQYFVTTSPAPYIDPDAPFNLYVENAMPLGDRGFFVTGWMRDPYQMLDEVELVSSLGFSLPMASAIHRVPRWDVREALSSTPYGGFQEDNGFVAYVPVPRDTRKTFKDVAELHGCRFKVRLKGGIAIDVAPPPAYRDAFSAREFVLKCTPPQAVTDAMLERCIGPAASAAQALCIREVAIKEVHHYGTQVAKPHVSLVIPLYKRLDFLRVQCATFAVDPAMRDVEIVYVLDSPEQELELRRMLEQLSALYRLPFTLVVMKRNAGYAAATNTGVKVSRAPLVVLLNSDVFPKTRGWTTAMAQAYESTPDIGALGPKLLYEDDSIQHAGMYFARDVFPFWLNLHYFKGYAEMHPGATQNRVVPAVTGACLMMRRSLYDDLGGLSTDYVIGDFEDSDLCLKAVQAGKRNCYLADIALYHLERQSVPLSETYNGTLAWKYNARLHDRQWGGLIAELMQQAY